MSENKLIEIPLHVLDRVTTPASKPSARRTPPDLDSISAAKSTDGIIIQRGGQTWLIPWGNLFDGARLTDTSWDDLRFPAQGINPPGLVSDPDVETSTGLLLFDAASTEMIAGVAQLPHTWNEASTIRPHVHWQKTTSAAGDVLWQIDYEVVNNGDVAPMAYGEQLQAASVASGTPDNDTANELLITPLGDVAMTSKTLSCIVFWKLSRIGGDAADTYGADARLLEFDIHYEIDSFGSDDEFTKG